MNRAAKICVGAGIAVLAAWVWFGYRGEMAQAKKQEAKSVKIRLVEGGRREVEDVGLNRAQ